MGHHWCHMDVEKRIVADNQATKCYSLVLAVSVLLVLLLSILLAGNLLLFFGACGISFRNLFGMDDAANVTLEHWQVFHSPSLELGMELALVCGEINGHYKQCQ